MSDFRAKFAEEVALSKARISNAVADFRAGVKERKQEADAVRRVEKAAAAARTDALLARQREAKRFV